MTERDEELIGWKAISEYSDLSERHLRRLELDGELPIGRKGKGKRAPVCISKENLDQCLEKRKKKEHEKTKSKRLHWFYWVLPISLGICCLFLLIIRPEPGGSYVKTFTMESNDNEVAFFLEDQHKDKGTRFHNSSIEQLPFHSPQESFDQGLAAWFGEFLNEPGLIECISSEKQYMTLHHWNEIPQTFQLPLSINDSVFPIELLTMKRIKGPGYDGLGVVCLTSNPLVHCFMVFDRKMKIIGTLLCSSKFTQVGSFGQQLVFSGVNSDQDLEVVAVSYWDLLYYKHSRLPTVTEHQEMTSIPLAHHLEFQGNSNRLISKAESNNLSLVKDLNPTGYRINPDWELECNPDPTEPLLVIVHK